MTKESQEQALLMDMAAQVIGTHIHITEPDGHHFLLRKYNLMQWQVVGEMTTRDAYRLAQATIRYGGTWVFT